MLFFLFKEFPFYPAFYDFLFSYPPLTSFFFG